MALAFGVKQSSTVNNICTGVNLFVVLFVLVAGGIKADFSNWNLSCNETSKNSTIHCGAGGFVPFGIDGIIKGEKTKHFQIREVYFFLYLGAATCFYGFVGFDCIATTGEEVKNPIKAIPRSIFWSLLIVIISYVGTSAVVTLMVPYYLQVSTVKIKQIRTILLTLFCLNYYVV